MLTHIFIVYKSGWLGVLPYAFQGPDNTPGVSIRTSHLRTLVGTYDITEKASPFVHIFQHNYLPYSQSLLASKALHAYESLQTVDHPPLHSRRILRREI